MAGKNIPQPTVSDSGVREVEWYDWAAFFAQVFRVPKITKYHHFEFSQDNVGEVTCVTLLSSKRRGFFVSVGQQAQDKTTNFDSETLLFFYNHF